MKKIPKHIPQDSSCKPKIDYPCTWQYKIIGESKTDITRVVDTAVQYQPYVLTDSNVSSSGRYISMNLELTVENDEQRLALYRIMGADPAIKVIL